MRLGKLFCQVYNEKERAAKNLPPLSPKEIFCDVIPPLILGLINNHQSTTRSIHHHRQFVGV